MLYRVLSVVLLPRKLVPSHGKSSRLVYFSSFLLMAFHGGHNKGNFFIQVEVSGGRGRPSTIVDKDEGLGKVIYVPFWL